MKLKKSIAVLMAAAMTLGAAYPVCAAAADAETAPAAEAAAEVYAVSAVSINEEKDPNLTGGQVYKIPEISVKYQAAKDCTLIVCVYTALDEFGNAQQLCGMGAVSVKEGSTEASVRIGRGSVPLNCTVCAYLISSKEGEPLSAQFKTVVKRELPEHDVKLETPAAISTTGLSTSKSDNFEVIVYNGAPDRYYVLYKYIEQAENVPESYWKADGAPDITEIQYLELVDSLPGWTQEQADNVKSVVFQPSYSDNAWSPGYHPTGVPNGAYCNVQYISFPAKMQTLQNFGYNRSEKMSTDAEGKQITTVTESGFKSLKALNIPDTVKTIAGGAFYNCPELKSAIISDSVEKIESSAFSNCKSLYYVTLPAGLTGLSASLFQGCEALKTIEIPGKVTSIGNACFSNAGIECITLPEGLQTLGNSAFAGCKELDTVEIPAGVTEIPQGCFTGTSMREIELHKDVKKITNSSFPTNNFTVYGDAAMTDIEKVCASTNYWSFVAKDSKPVTENFTDLKPNTVYNFYHFTNTSKQTKVFGTNTLMYVTQAVSDANGKLSVTYRPANSFGSADSQFTAVVCGETVTAPAETTTRENDKAKCGDVNLDGKVDVSDAVMIARFVVMDKDLVITDQGLANADASGDGKVSDQDITSVLMYIAKRVTDLPYDPANAIAKS